MHVANDMTTHRPALDLRLLHVLSAVMGAGTVTAAARRLHRTQSAVSRSLAQLEAQLGFALFERERKRLLPTEAGLAFLGEAERALAALDEVGRAAQRLRMGQTLPLRLLAPSHVAQGLLPAALAELAGRHPGLQFELEIRQREYLAHWVRNRQFDLGIAAGWEPAVGVGAMALLSLPLWVVLPPGHALAARRSVSLTDLAGHPLLAMRAGTPLRQCTDAAFARAAQAPVVRGEAGSSMALGQMAAAGLGAALVDAGTARLLQRQGAALLRPLRPRVELAYHLVHPEVRPLDPLALQLAAALRRSAAAVESDLRAGP